MSRNSKRKCSSSRRVDLDSLRSDTSSEGPDESDYLSADELPLVAVAPKQTAPMQQAGETYRALFQGEHYSIYELSLCDALNLCFELSGFGANLYTARDYESASETECIEMIDSSLQRCTTPVPAVSPLMRSLSRMLKAKYIEKPLQDCYQFVHNEALKDLPDYVPSESEFIALARDQTNDRLIKSGAKLTETCCRLPNQVDPVFTAKGSARCQEKLAESAREVLVQVFTSNQINSNMAQTFRSWLVLFCTSNIQILRLTGIFVLKVMAEIAVSRVDELLDALLSQGQVAHKQRGARDSMRAIDSSELELTLEFLLETALPTFKDRVSDISPLIACLSTEGCAAVVKISKKVFTEFLDTMTHISMRHPSPVVRSVGMNCLMSLITDDVQHRTVQRIQQIESELSEVFKKRLLPEALEEQRGAGRTREDSAAERTENAVEVCIFSIIRHGSDTSLLVRWSCSEVLKCCYTKHANLIKDRQVTSIVNMMFSSFVKLPLLLRLAMFIDRVVFSHTIVPAATTAALQANTSNVSDDIVYCTLIQFLSDYADDVEWQKHHENLIRAFFPICPQCRDFDKIWRFLNTVYRSTDINDIDQQYDWLSNTKTSNTLLNIVKFVWNANQLMGSRLSTAENNNGPGAGAANTSQQILPVLFSQHSSNSALLAQAESGNPVFLSQHPKFLEAALENDFPKLLLRARSETSQQNKLLSLLFNLVSLKPQSDISNPEGLAGTVFGSGKKYSKLIGVLEGISQRYEGDPLVLHSALKCLSRLLSGDDYLKLYSKLFGSVFVKPCQNILKQVNSEQAVIAGDAMGEPEPEDVPQEGVLKLLAQEPVNKAELRRLLVLIRVMIYNDTRNLVCEKLDFIDDLLNYVQRFSEAGSLEKGGDHCVDVHLMINALDVLWLAQAKFVERLTERFNQVLLPTIATNSSASVAHLTMKTSSSAFASSLASANSANSQQLMDVLKSFNEDLDIYKEMNLQLACYVSNFSEVCRQTLLAHRSLTPDTDTPMNRRNRGVALSKEALISALQCSRLLCMRSVLQIGTTLWAHVRAAVAALPQTQFELEELKKTINHNCLACLMPPESRLTLEVAYFIDTMKQVYSSKRRQVEQYFLGHDYTQYGFMNQFVGNLTNPVGPVEIWDVYKNLTGERDILEFINGLDLENLAFVAQVQLTTALCHIPDKTLWKESSVGPVILAYFRSKTPILQELAEQFMKKCYEYDQVAEKHIQDVTDRPLLMLLILTTLQTLLKRALESQQQDKVVEVKRLATEFAARLPKDYWKKLSNILFMNFVWLAIQKAYSCDPKGYLLDVVVEGMLSVPGQAIPKRYVKPEANNQINALRELAETWHRQNNTIVIDQSFIARLMRFLKVCLPTATLSSDHTASFNWPAPIAQTS